MLGSQLIDLLVPVAEGAENLRCLLPEGWDGVHAWLDVTHRDRWQQRLERPDGRADLTPALACLQLRVVPELLHRVHAGIGNLRPVQPCDNLVDGELTEDGVDHGM